MIIIEHKLSFMNLKIDKSWSLFLDRDGVINERLPDDYVKTWEEFRFINGSLEAIKILAQSFGIVVVVSNQQGVGKGLMSDPDLQQIHLRMQRTTTESGGRIDKVYYSPYLASEKHHTRKPRVGMGILARRDFSAISFKKSVMVGDSFGDVLFGKRLGMKTVFIGDRHFARQHPDLIDFVFPDLITFAKSIEML
ncbi:MAG: D-glycero-D-manno-heptose 1 7-bisphosphate phosphatase [Bacteroidetes bacterium]|nr:MAG: D-glycero-D-manno-heptose 1 7-bisphosphate phosphatase [Bacteroidota bacterium]